MDQVIYLLLGAGIYEGVYLIFPEDHPYRRQIGAALIAVCVVGWLAYSRELPTPKVSVPSVVVYFGTAFALSLSAAGLHRWRQNTLVPRNALKVAARLDDFVQMCQGRLGNTYRLSHAELNAKQLAFHDEYLDSYGEDIRGIHRKLTAKNPVFADLLDTMLGSLPTRTIQQPALAKWVANLLRNEAKMFPQSWLAWSVLATFGAYFLSASLLWLALFAWARK